MLALHGCTQTANDYYTNSGWKKYADLYHFAVVFLYTTLFAKVGQVYLGVVGIYVVLAMISCALRS